MHSIRKKISRNLSESCLMEKNLRSPYLLSCGSAIGLIILGLMWELFLAPLRPNGSWLVLKIIPLLFALPGILKGKRYTYQWASMLSMLYLSEGIVRAMTEKDLNSKLGGLEIVLSIIFFLSTIIYVKKLREK